MQFSFPAKARSINPKTTLVVIFLVILLDQCGVLLIQPIYPELLHSLTGQSTADSALWMGRLTASYAVMQIIFAPVIGRLSDYYGRRKLLLLSMFAFAVDYAIMALAQNIYVLFLGRIVSGIAGSCVALGFAAVTDISSAEDRMKNLGVVYAAFGLGLVLGPIFGSIGVRFSLRGPLWLAVVFSIVNFLLIYYLFCETRTGSKEKKQGASGLICQLSTSVPLQRSKGLITCGTFYSARINFDDSDVALLCCGALLLGCKQNRLLFSGSGNGDFRGTINHRALGAPPLGRCKIFIAQRRIFYSEYGSVFMGTTPH